MDADGDSIVLSRSIRGRPLAMLTRQPDGLWFLVMPVDTPDDLWACAIAPGYSDKCEQLRRRLQDSDASVG